MSVPQIPQAAPRNSTSPSPTCGIGTVSTTTRPLPRYTPARISCLPRGARDFLSSCAVCELMRLVLQQRSVNLIKARNRVFKLFCGAPSGAAALRDGWQNPVELIPESVAEIAQFLSPGARCELVRDRPRF